MKTLVIALAVTAAFAQPPQKPAAPVGRDVPLSKETILGMELVDRQAKEANDTLEKLKGLLISPLQAQYNSLISEACRSAGIEMTECSYDPAKKVIRRVEPQTAKAPNPGTSVK